MDSLASVVGEGKDIDKSIFNELLLQILCSSVATNYMK